MPIDVALFQRIKKPGKQMFSRLLIVLRFIPAYMKNRKVSRMKQGTRMTTDQSM